MGDVINSVISESTLTCTHLCCRSSLISSPINRHHHHHHHHQETHYFNHLRSQHTAKTHASVCVFAGDVKLNVTGSKVAQEHEEDPSSHPSFQPLLSWRLPMRATDSPLWLHGCRGGTDSSNGGGGTLRLLGVQARRCDERFCRLWIQASMIVHEGCTQPGETCWGWAGKLVLLYILNTKINVSSDLSYMLACSLWHC